MTFAKALRRLPSVLGLCWLFLIELFASAIRVGLLVLRPNLRAQLRPAMVEFPLTVQSDVGITLLANLVTLTPGTLTVDVSEDRRKLLIHCVDVDNPEAVIADIANGFERRVIEVLS